MYLAKGPDDWIKNVKFDELGFFDEADLRQGRRVVAITSPLALGAARRP